jgi:hypothetical protein
MIEDRIDSKHPLPELACPACDGPIAIAFGGAQAPRPGDFSICVHCSAVLKFGEDCALHAPSTRELRLELSDAELEQIRRFAVAATLARLAGAWPKPRVH